MNKEIFSFLKNYGTDIYSINRLLVSSYINIKNIEVINNQLIKNHLIQLNELDYPDLEKFITLIKKVDKEYRFEELLELFEFVISPSDKLINGAIYTPDDIRKYIIQESFKQFDNKPFDDLKIADISCGCGGFLIDATNVLKEKTNKTYSQIFKKNIFGIDIQEYSINRTKILLSLLAIENGEDKKEFKFNLYDNDSLIFNWKEDRQIKQHGGFDIILGNPPYVCSRNMDENTKLLMKKWTTCSTGHPDLYIPFFQIGFELLKPNGILGYITVNTFIKSFNGRAIRKYFQDHQVDLKIIDFEDEQIFNSRMTYTAICFLINQPSDCLKYVTKKRNAIAKTKSIKYKEHKYSKLSIEKGWYLKNRSFVKKIEKTGTQFGEIYNTKSGIATLRNNVYIFTPLREDKEYFFVDEENKVEKSICKEIVNSNFLVKVNDISNLKEQIIFPYGYHENGEYFVIDENTMEIKYPCTYKYLLKNREELNLRDKGKGKDYKHWHAFGRNQSLDRKKYKLLFPQLAREGFQSYISEDENLYFYNGMAVMSDEKEKLQILQKIFLTDIFWKYVSSISKHYASNYYSLGRNYIKHFGICDFTEEEKQYLIKETDLDKINSFVNEKYNITP